MSAPAAAPGRPRPSSADLARLAGSLRLRIATRRLVAHILDGDEGAVDAGRHRYLGAVVEASSDLATALRRGDRAAIEAHWSSAAATRATDPDFLRGLAVLHLERALSDPPAAIAERAWIVATALWARLAGSSEPPAASIGPPDAAQRALDAILDLHTRFGARRLAAGDRERAAVHARCLQMCRVGETAIGAALAAHKLDGPVAVDGARLADLAGRAADRLESWSTALVDEATAAADGAEALARCEPGMRRNYQEGIGRLTPFIDLGVPDARVLLAALTLCNEWADDLASAKRDADLDALLVRAGVIAGALSSLSRPGDGMAVANQALAQHHVHRGRRGEPATALKDMRLALVWNPELVRTVANALNNRASDICNDTMKDEPAGDIAWRDAVEAISGSERMLVEAVAVDPSYELAERNLKIVRANLEHARQQLTQAVRGDQ